MPSGSVWGASSVGVARSADDLPQEAPKVYLQIVYAVVYGLSGGKWMGFKGPLNLAH